MSVAGFRAILGALAATLLMSASADAGLQRWSVVYLDSAGQPTAYGSAASAEAYVIDERGFSVGIGCAPDGGHSFVISAPEGGPADFAGPEMAPSLRIGMPGNDAFSGPTGDMVFDGTRYVGRIATPALDALRASTRDGRLMISEFTTRTILKLKLQSFERAINEVRCK